MCSRGQVSRRPRQTSHPADLNAVAVELLHLAATAFMAGVIAFVQFVHYPLMAHVGAPGYAEYQSRHATLTSGVVGIPMLAEALAAVWLMATRVEGRQVAILGVGLLVMIWTSTALLQVPAHKALGRGFDTQTHRRLVATNWIRTIAWVARIPLAASLVISAGTS
jgi:hypothetical protein